MEIIAMDSHKRYTQICVQDQNGQILCEQRVNHKKGNIFEFLNRWTDNSKVAVETIGNWYWIIDEIEQAMMQPQLVHAHKAKLMLGSINKTDKLDARGLNKLQRTGTLPTVWIPDADIRDKRELPRTRMVLSNSRTRLKNRIHSVIDKYGLHTDFDGISDIFGTKGRQQMSETIKKLPKQTNYTVKCLLRELDMVQREIARIEKRMVCILKNRAGKTIDDNSGNWIHTGSYDL